MTTIKLKLILLIQTLLWAGVYSQSVVDLKTAPKKLLKNYNKADLLYKSNELEKAKNGFEQICLKEPRFIHAQLKLGSVCFELEQWLCAEEHYQKVLDLNPNFDQKVHYALALSAYHSEHFALAKKEINTFINSDYNNPELKQKANSISKTIHFADSAYNFKTTLNLVSLSSLNTSMSEYLPSLTADGKTMIFTRRVGPLNEDLMISHLDDGNQWAEAQPITELNSIYNEGAPAISPDGQWIVFTSCNKEDGYGGCDLYISYLQDRQWTSARNLGDVINTPAYEAQPCIADNGQTLYFTSTRKGTMGGKDIWVSKRKKDHSWTKPKNCGPIINTEKDEQCPFLHPNESKFYFSSDGHIGFGKSDLFCCQIDSKGQWSEAVNLGYPINGIYEDLSLIVNYTGDKAYKASDLYSQQFKLKSKNQTISTNIDLIEFDLPTELQALASSFVEIRMKDKKTLKPIQGKLSIYDTTDHRLIYESDKSNNDHYFAVIPGQRYYAIHFYHPDYGLYSYSFLAEKNKRTQPIRIEQLLDKIQDQEESFILRNLFFTSGSYEILSASEPELNYLADLLKGNPSYSILITGHTDDIGTEDSNLELSKKRAESIKSRLILMGIEADRIITDGKGESQPLEANLNEEARSKNRRVEYKLKKH
ncbi:MAG TPA: OmpA family protein [Saprospiraceae bacterium]|nr:OmpA family protein [Saprospiraceae bacterium]